MGNLTRESIVKPVYGHEVSKAVLFDRLYVYAISTCADGDVVSMGEYLKIEGHFIGVCGNSECCRVCQEAEDYDKYRGLCHPCADKFLREGD